MGRHLVDGFEGLLRRVMYVFDDAVVFVNPPPAVRAADFLGLVAGKLKAAKVQSVDGQAAATRLADQYVSEHRFADIIAFSRQFGEAGFDDPRVTSTVLAEQVARTERIPLDDIAAVGFRAHQGGLHPHVTVTFTRIGSDSPLRFDMRYRASKAHEVHQALTSVLGARVAPLTSICDRGVAQAIARGPHLAQTKGIVRAAVATPLCLVEATDRARQSTNDRRISRARKSLLQRRAVSQHHRLASCSRDDYGSGPKPIRETPFKCSTRQSTLAEMSSPLFQLEPGSDRVCCRLQRRTWTGSPVLKTSFMPSRWTSTWWRRSTRVATGGSVSSTRSRNGRLS
jgi:hypothetical protein